MTWPTLFCWSKIGPEAGLSLEEILRWKEFQRSLSDGLFLWGIGNIPNPKNRDVFIKAVRNPRVLFSEQAGKAKADYENPSSTVLWTHYLDGSGREVGLPRYAAVTSKSGSSKHFALVCKSDTPLQVASNIDFDIGLFGNYRGSPNIAFQQPAPLVEPNRNGSPKKLYKRGFWADLAQPYFITLTRARELRAEEHSQIRRLMQSEQTDANAFSKLISQLKA